MGFLTPPAASEAAVAGFQKAMELKRLNKGKGKRSDWIDPIFKAKQKKLDDDLWRWKGLARGGAHFPLLAVTDNDEGHRSGQRLEARSDRQDVRREEKREACAQALATQRAAHRAHRQRHREEQHREQSGAAAAAVAETGGQAAAVAETATALGQLPCDRTHAPMRPQPPHSPAATGQDTQGYWLEGSPAASDPSRPAAWGAGASDFWPRAPQPRAGVAPAPTRNPWAELDPPWEDRSGGQRGWGSWGPQGWRDEGSWWSRDSAGSGQR